MKKRPLLLEQLEERIFLDANPLAVVDTPVEDSVVDVTAREETETTETERGEAVCENTIVNEDTAEENVKEITTEQSSAGAASESNGKVETTVEIVVVDSRVHDHESLVEDIRATVGDESRTVEVLVIDGQESGVEQLSEILSSRDEVGTLHIFSYGDEGILTLGTDTLNADSLSEHSDQLRNWRTSLTTESDILLYGCRIAQTEAGQAFVQQLANYTGADFRRAAQQSGMVFLIRFRWQRLICR